MGDIIKHIVEVFENEFNREIRRGKYPETRINISWPDALDELASIGSRQDKKADSPTPEARTWKAINDIP